MWTIVPQGTQSFQPLCWFLTPQVGPRSSAPPFSRLSCYRPSHFLKRFFLINMFFIYTQRNKSNPTYKYYLLGTKKNKKFFILLHVRYHKYSYTDNISNKDNTCLIKLSNILYYINLTSIFFFSNQINSTSHYWHFQLLDSLTNIKLLQ